MQVIEGGPDPQALADELLEPFLQWLKQIGRTPAKFREVLAGAESIEDQVSLLGITTDQFMEGLESIGSLFLYAAILGISKEEVYEGFESNRYIAPRWFIRDVEEVVRGKLALGCGE